MEWEKFGEAAKAAGTEDRSEVMRALIHWYMRTPGAKLPPRPPVVGKQDGVA